MFSEFRLGKHAPVYPLLGRRLQNYMATSAIRYSDERDWLPAFLEQVGGETKIPDWQNRRIGCCTCAAPAAAVAVQTANAQALQILDDIAVEAAYRRISAYDGSPETDLGANSEAAMLLWARDGLVINDQRRDVLSGWTVVANGDHDRIRFGIDQLGPLLIGIRLPNAYKTTNEWSVPLSGAVGEDYKPGGWGLHRMCLTSYSKPKRMYKGLSWGYVVELEEPVLENYMDEGHALLSRTSWLNVEGLTPSGVDWQSALDDFHYLVRA